MKKEFVFRFVLALGIFFLVYQFALKPLMGDKLNKITNIGTKEKSVIVSSGAEYNVVVYGEEPDGIAAAISAARLGGKTLLLSKSNNLGGIISRSLLTSLDIPYGKNNVALNGGFLTELVARTGTEFSPQDYMYSVNTLVKNEKKIQIKYGVRLDSVSIKDHKLITINISVGDKKLSVSGDMFIDASVDGDLLEASKVPFTKGSEDLHLKDTYMPVQLNYEMKGTNIAKVSELIKKMDAGFYKTLAEYKPDDVNSWISNFKIYVLDEKTIIIQGITVSNININDAKSVKNAYVTAVKEAKDFSLFLSNRFDQLKGWKYLGIAEKLYIRENRHFKGLYNLSVNDVLGNSDFDKTIAMGSYPVQIGKFAGKSIQVAGKPVQYGIPVGCIIPSGVDNLLMTGAKISYSSLAASSAGTIGTSIATGNSAGILSVYCLINHLKPADIDSEIEQEKIMDFQKYLVKQGLNFPKEEIKNKLESNWAYSELKQLLSLGLIAGGMENNYYLDRKAVQSDLAILLMNGIYRTNPKKYSLALDTRMRPFFNSAELTREKAALILEALYNINDKSKDPYKKVCDLGYINDILQLSLKNKQVLTMDDVYYLSGYIINLNQ